MLYNIYSDQNHGEKRDYLFSKYLTLLGSNALFKTP